MKHISMDIQILSIRHQIASCLLISQLLFSIGFSDNASAKTEYREYVTCHVGRNTYISGEPIFYKALCRSNLPDKRLLSEVLYIELIDINEKSLIAQVLQVDNNTASSVVNIPDTLATGLYFLKGYTQWMKNFDESSFSSTPIFVYNQYDDEALQALSVFKLSFEPEICIQGGKMISDLPVKVLVRVPGLFGRKLEISLEEGYLLKSVQKVVTNPEGEAEFIFIPKMGMNYRLTVTDSIHGSASIALPPVEYSGYSMNLLSSGKENFLIKITGSNVPPEPLKLCIFADGTVLSEMMLQPEQLDHEMYLQYPAHQDYFEIRLQNLRGEILIRQPVFIPPADIIRPDKQSNRYTTREEITIPLNLKELSLQQKSGVSVSVNRLLFDKNESGMSDSNMNYCSEVALQEQNIRFILPRYYPGPLYNSHANIQYPAEDMGLLFTGRITPGPGTLVMQNYMVMLVVKDTMGSVVAATTDSLGCFSMLLNECGNKEGQLILFSDGVSLIKDNKLELDEKFFYRSSRMNNQNRLIREQDSGFIKVMQDEAQRVLIQKAFGNNNTGTDLSLSGSTCSVERFYGEPEITVYPGIFFFLPNFEEIAREILPRVRYKYTKDECELLVYHTEDNTHSYHPVVFIDGIYISDYRLLYEMNSDDIQRIEIQSGLRVSGQLLYDGLLSIFTTPKYKAGKARKDANINYSIPGYVNVNSEYSPDIEAVLKNPKIPVFANQLYWNPLLLPDENGTAEIRFTTSDEEGEYVIEIMGITTDGIPVQYRKHFEVGANY